MGQGGIVGVTKEIGKPIAKDLGYDLVDVQFNKEQEHFFLRVFIAKRGGVSLEDCQKMTELLSQELDLRDPTDVPYFLEVSSPGLDRPLETEQDFNRNIGEEVEVRLYQPIEDRRRVEGILKAYNNENFIIAMENEGELEIPREAVSLMRLVIKF